MSDSLNIPPGATQTEAALIKARAECETLCEELSISHATCADLEREATEAEADCERLRGERDSWEAAYRETLADSGRYQVQRDQARTALAECRALAADTENKDPCDASAMPTT